MNFRKAPFFLLAFCSMFVIFAQGLMAYSAFPVSGDVFSLDAGFISNHSSVRERGMGNSGSALFDSINYSVSNPASIALIDYTIFSVSYLPEITRSRSATDESWGFAQDFPSVEMVIPAGKYGVFMTSIIRERAVDFNGSFTDKDGFGVKRTLFGGLWSGRLSYANNWGKKLLFGLSLGSLHGKVASGRYISDFADTNAPLTPSRLQKAEYSGLLTNLGLAYRFGGNTIALSGTIPVGNADVDITRQTIQYWSSTSTADSTVQTQTLKVNYEAIPASVRVGLALLPLPRLSIAADGEAFFRNQSVQDVEYQVGLGAEIRFTEGRDIYNYFKNIPLRLGLFYRERPGETNSTVETGGSIGFSLPTVGNFGLLNFAIEGYRRADGAVLSSGYREDAARISVQYMHKGRWGRLRRSQVGEIQ